MSVYKKNAPIGISAPTLIMRVKTVTDCYEILEKLGWSKKGDLYISPAEIKIKTTISINAYLTKKEIIRLKQTLMRLYSREYVKFMEILRINKANGSNDNQLCKLKFNNDGQRINAIKQCRQVVSVNTLKILE